MNARIKPASVAFAQDAFAHYRADLHRFLLRRLRNSQDASDLVQEVFLRVLQLDRTEAVRNPQAYIYGIASHVAHEFLHRNRRDLSVPFIDSDPAQYPARDAMADEVGLESELQKALAELSPVQLRILVVRQRDGLSYPEIARSLGLSTHTVRKYLDRALASIRRRLARNEGAGS